MLFAEQLHQDVLKPYSHRFITFSITKRLRIYFRFDCTLLGKLSQTAWESWKEHVQKRLGDAAPGAVMAVHTAGSLLKFNPHVHGIALDGGTAKDAQFIQLENIDTEDLTSWSEKNLAPSKGVDQE